MGAPGGQKPKFSPKMTPNIDIIQKSSYKNVFNNEKNRILNKINSMAITNSNSKAFRVFATKCI